MPYAPRQSVTATRRRYTVVLECCDPPVPVQYWNTDSATRALSIFDALKGEEIQHGGGGEFTLKVYHHPRPGRSAVMLTENPDYGPKPFVYYLHYPDGQLTHRFSYMDLVSQA